MDSPEHQRRAIVQYFDSQARGDEHVEHAERVASERVLSTTYDVWDVHTDQGRWWVITNPTNLYSQDDFKSMDYALSFHIGVTMRVMHASHREPPGGEVERERFKTTWRKWSQAADAMDRASEPEAFQAIGMQCREALLNFIKESTTDEMVPGGSESPKKGDFIQWSDLLANHIAPGDSSARLRGYLKANAKATWELVNNLTHQSGARLLDAEMALDATAHIINAFAIAIIRKERGEPRRCPECGSYRLVPDFREGLVFHNLYATLCESCGWEEVPPIPKPEVPLSKRIGHTVPSRGTPKSGPRTKPKKAPPPATKKVASRTAKRKTPPRKK